MTRGLDQTLGPPLISTVLVPLLSLLEAELAPRRDLCQILEH